MGLDNLDALVMIYKNWPNNTWIDCKLNEEGIMNFFVQKTNYLMNVRKNFMNKATLRMSKKTLWFHVLSSWKAFPSALVGYLLHLFICQFWLFFHFKGLGYVFLRFCDFVWPHEPLINDIHCCRFLDLC